MAICHWTDIQAERRKVLTKRIQIERERRQSEAELLTSRLFKVLDLTTQLAPTLGTLVEEADSLLDRAEQEFKEGAFAPFWDAVEGAADCLATFDQRTQQLTNESKTYYESLANKNHTFPSLAVKLSGLPKPFATADRLKTIVRRAQKSFQFASIYEQRRTNKLLRNGFLSLSAAISDLGDMLESSVSGLQDSLASHLAEVVEHQIATRDVVSEFRKEVTH